MKPLSEQHFEEWMVRYGKASAENDAKASSELFASDAEYYETPFKEPLVGKDAIYQYWNEGANRLKDKESTFKIIAMKDNLGIARWQSKFTVIQTGRRVALDCIFLVEFDEHKKCKVFREWWHLMDINQERPAIIEKEQ